MISDLFASNVLSMALEASEIGKWRGWDVSCCDVLLIVAVIYRRVVCDWKALIGGRARDVISRLEIMSEG